MPIAMSSIPSVEEITTEITSSGLVLMKSIALLNAKMYGTRNAAIASLVAFTAVFIGGALAMAEPA